MEKSESIRRLEVLRDYLKTNVKDEDLNLNEWDCGTVKCAVGWACCIPKFNSLGFFSKVGEGDRLRYPFYRGKDGWEAVYDFFDLSRDQALSIFSEGSDRYIYISEVSVNDVAEAIDALIQEIKG